MFNFNQLALLAIKGKTYLKQSLGTIENSGRKGPNVRRGKVCVPEGGSRRNPPDLLSRRAKPFYLFYGVTLLLYGPLCVSVCRATLRGWIIGKCTVEASRSVRGVNCEIGREKRYLVLTCYIHPTLLWWATDLLSPQSHSLNYQFIRCTHFSVQFIKEERRE
jgi:hypothetical protein